MENQEDTDARRTAQVGNRVNPRHHVIVTVLHPRDTCQCVRPFSNFDVEKWCGFHFSNAGIKGCPEKHPPFSSSPRLAAMSFLNATTIPSPYYDALYPATDFSSLTWLEQQWVAWYVWIGNPIIATGLMSFLMHEVNT